MNTMKNTEKTLRATLLCFVAIIAVSTMSCSLFDKGDSEATDADSISQKHSSLIDIYTVSDSDTVFICTGKASKRFHSSDTCEGIMQCTKEIIQTTRADAEKRKRTFCHKCYRDSTEEL